MPSPGAPSSPAPFRGSGPFLKTVPPLSLPLRHFAFAAASFLTFAAAFAWGAPRLLGFGFQAGFALGLVHALTLGWIAMTILGALSQMIPAHGQVPLAAPRLVKLAHALLAGGIAGFVGLLWSGSVLYWIPACALVTAVFLYIACLGTTLGRSEKLDWTGRHLALGLGYLALLATLGVLMAWDRQRGLIFREPDAALIAHVHLALVGWVSQTIMGASYRLVAPITLSHLDRPAPGSAALGLVNAGLLGLAADKLFLRLHWTPAWACLMTAGFLVYAWQARALLKGGSRDAAAGFVILAFAGGAAWAWLGLSLAFGWLADSPGARAAYVFTAVIGWVTPWILGQIHKLAPFLIWLHVYSPRNWKPPVRVPKIEDLTSRRLAWTELALLAPSIPCGVLGFLRESEALLRAGGVLLLGCALVYVVNTALTLRHLLGADPRWDLPITTP